MNLALQMLVENILSHKVFITVQAIELTTTMNNSTVNPFTQVNLHHTQLHAFQDPILIHPILSNKV